MGKTIGHNELMSAIPETPPRLMLDRLELDLENRSARGLKAVSAAEPFFAGHFPDAPIMPGVLQIAAMLQASAVLIRADAKTIPETALPRIKKLTRIKFRRPILPGHTMDVDVQLLSFEDGEALVEAKTQVDGQTACSGKLTIEFVDPADNDALQAAAPAAPAIEMDDPEQEMDVEAIMGTIPHRFPFQFIERAKIKEDHIIGYKNVSASEPFVIGNAAGTFPEYLQVEAAAQTGCALVLSRPESAGMLAYFMSIDSAAFYAPVLPGSVITMDMSLSKRGRFGLGSGTLYADGRKVGECALKFALIDRENG